MESSPECVNSGVGSSLWVLGWCRLTRAHLVSARHGVLATGCTVSRPAATSVVHLGWSERCVVGSGAANSGSELAAQREVQRCGVNRALPKLVTVRGYQTKLRRLSLKSGLQKSLLGSFCEPANLTGRCGL